MKVEKIKELYNLLDDIYYVLADSDIDGNLQKNNIGIYGYNLDDNYFENISILKEILEKVVGYCELNNIKEVKTENVN